MYSKKIKQVAQLLIVVCLGVIVFVASCNKTEKSNTFPIMIESIEIWYDGAQVHLSYPEEGIYDTVFVRLQGYIGPNECHELYYYPTLYTQQGTKNKHIIEAWGIQTKPKDGSMCIPNISYLDCIIGIFFTEDEGTGEHFFYTKNKSGNLVELGSVVVVY